jgi:AcrR family transcriptional regulator
VPPRRARRAAVRPRRRVRLDTDERRRQLLQLAKVMFSNRSFDDVSIDDLARDAKISKGLLYHYFPTKRDLYVAGLREIADELVAAIEQVPDDLAPIERVRAGLDAYLDHIARHSRAFVSLMRGGIGSDPTIAAVIDGVRTRLFEQFVQGSPLAQALADNVRFQTAVRGWIGFVEAVTIDWCANPRLQRAEVRELLTEVLFEIMSVIVPKAIA